MGRRGSEDRHQGVFHPSSRVTLDTSLEVGVTPLAVVPVDVPALVTTAVGVTSVLNFKYETEI